MGHRTIRTWAGLVAIAGVLAGCGPHAEALDDAASALGSQGEAVTVLGAGPYRRIRGCSGICVSTYYFWADIAVRNDAFHKGVGVRYSVDGWQSDRVAWASYEGDLGDGWERWGVDVELGTGQRQPHPEVEIAAFAEMNGATHWDPNNHYYVYESVFAEAPVRLLSSEVSFDPIRGGRLEGRVRVFDLAYDKQVSLRYSTDGWGTYDEVAARWVRGDDWSFETPDLLLPNGRLPDTVRFAVRYDVLGDSHWDNNRGADYGHRLHPRFDVVADGPLDAPRSGISRPGATPASDIPIQRTEVRVDAGPWALSDRAAVSTWALGDGLHTVEVRATLEGGYQATETFDIEAHNRLQPRDHYQPMPDVTVPGRTDAAWHVARDSRDRLIVLWDSGRIGRYAGYQDVNAPFLFEPGPSVGGMQSFAIDDQDRVYAIGRDRGLVRWRADGRLDRAFGQAGAVDLSGVVGSSRVCAFGQPVAGPAALYVADTCNRRVLRFDLDGVFTGELDVASSSRVGVPVHGVHDGQALWIASQGDLLRITDGPSAPMVIDRRIPMSEPLNASGLAIRPGGGFYLTTSDNQLAVLAADGSVLTRWTGGPRDAPFEGNFSLGRAPVVYADGSVSVLGVEGGRLARFEGALRP